MRKTVITLLFLMLALIAYPQNKKIKEYYPPTDTLVQQKLKMWQGYKFGLLMHWGTYSQWGIVESWSLCSEDEGWCARKGPYANDYAAYKKEYEKLQTTFNPVNFNPDKWAAAAKNAGMKYVVFTTKHHDGFCMFDTKQTDYKITSELSPFHTNVKADVTKEIFNSFRKEKFMVGAYFSKPDWHNENYWWPYFATPNRMSNYDPKKYPDRWQQYEDFTYNQLKELCTGYGKLDLLWLDGGWVRPDSTITKEEESWIKTPWRNEINMHRIATMARQNQPGILIVDRSVYGWYQNYLTPEQQVPAKPLPYPWETCMTMANSWSYVPGDHYKSTNELIHLLCKIVSRGGNLLLNIAPSPLGDWDSTAYSRLDEIGEWMNINSDCIYETQPFAPYEEGRVVYTSKNNNVVFAIYLANENENMPAIISLSGLNKIKIKNISLLGTGKTKWKTVDDKSDSYRIEIQNSPSTIKSIKEKHAYVYKIEM
ncbi:MAG: alpha-L-fucosidase [Bacteroidia bacterium]